MIDPRRRPRRVPRGLRPRARAPARLGLRRLGQPAPPAAGGERDERDEGDVQRLPAAERARRLVGRGLQRQERLGRSRATPNPTSRSPTRPTPTRFYTLLENEVIPIFYERDADGIPQRWCELIKEALVTCGPTFTAARMLDDYVTRIYTARRPRGRRRRACGRRPATTSGLDRSADQGRAGVNGCSSSSPSWTTPQLDSGTAFHAPSRSPSGSETIDARLVRELGQARDARGAARRAGRAASSSRASASRPRSSSGTPRCRSPSVVATVICIGNSTPCRWPTSSTKPTIRSTAPRRVVLEAEREREVEHRLGVGRALDRREQRRLRPRAAARASPCRSRGCAPLCIQSQRPCRNGCVFVSWIAVPVEARTCAKKSGDSMLDGELAQVAVVPGRMRAAVDAAVGRRRRTSRRRSRRRSWSSRPAASAGSGRRASAPA